ncbi:CBS domain-containing protein [Acholeplasma sp. OttesenSCG-928-E16]|nr:CBS domain-containing protein [Acholeplasma sp. OttesenSCG-928-E16]
MNVLFCLLPKEKVAFVEDKMSIRQVMEKMEAYRYSTIPLIDESGKYIGTISEGDILWFLKERHTFDLKELEKVSILEVKRNKDNQVVYANANIEDIIETSIIQNFVPVLDDRHLFIGIVTRKSIIQFLMEKREK